MSKTDSLPYVEAELNYLGPMTERPRYYAYEIGERSNMTYDPHRMRIHDMRPISSDVSLDTQGFALVEQRSAVQDFWDDDEVRRVYYPEAERVIKQVTGASRVFIFDHLQRRRVTGLQDRAPGGPRQPATRVHVDHTAKSGPQRVRDLLPDEAEELLKGRVQVINFWRPLFQPVAGRAARGVRLPHRGSRRPCPLGPGLQGTGRRDLLGALQPGAPMVLRAGNAARRGAAVEDRRHQDRHPGALHAAHLVHRSDDTARRASA